MEFLIGTDGIKKGNGSHITDECTDKIRYVGMTNYRRHAQYKKLKLRR